MGEAAVFAARLGLPVRDAGLLEQALTHSSWVHEHPAGSQAAGSQAAGSPGHNERLEFLGDAVVNLAIATALHDRHPLDDEGVLSARRAAIVSAPALARLAARIDLGSYLRLGQGEERSGGRVRPLLLASGFEAVAGAVYLDLGLANPEIAEDQAPSALKSPKSRLQELTQRSGHGRPVYDVVEASGPDHRRQFVVTVSVDGQVRGQGEGASRQAAETAAAARAIDDSDASGVGS